ncbi:MAG: T9SS type A sorting domain-containing protein [Phaeodactylibacter sp.]|nr:T9SS type A sorting domain-containing protein [Phaeodactylibacter sp.]
MRKALLCHTLFCLVISLSAQVDLQEGLVAFYPFNGNALDESINTNHAIEVSNPILTEDCNGAPESAYFFDGVDDYIEFPNNPFINFENSSAFAISVWIKVPESQIDLGGAVNDILVKWSNSESEPYPYSIRLFNQNNTFPGRIWAGRYEGEALGCGNFPIIISTSRVDDDQWHNLIFQRIPEGLLELYIDAEIEGNVLDDTVCEINNFRNLLIGLRTKNNPFRRAFHGSIDNIRIYNRALNQMEIDAINNKIMSSIDAAGKKGAITVFPNPVTANRININNSGGGTITKLSLYDATGRFIRYIPEQENNAAGLANGIYYLKIEFKDAAPLARKVVVCKQ